MPTRRRRRRRLEARRRLPLTVEQILIWADDHFGRTGRWPRCTDKHVLANLNEKWRNIDAALRDGGRGLDGNSSLPQLLSEHRGVRNLSCLPDLTITQIVAWADAHHAQTGEWPHGGPVLASPGDKWECIQQALHEGGRGLPGGDTLARVLARERGVRNPGDLPPLRDEDLLAWAEAHHHRTGNWPKFKSGPIPEAPGETWAAVAHALQDGLRGQPGGDSLPRFLSRHFGVPNHRETSRLSRSQILSWADAYHDRTGHWPHVTSGAILEADGETWARIDTALREGLRGLKGVSSLPRLLASCRRARNKAQTPPLTEERILEWADAHHARTGTWPSQNSGRVLESPEETWAAVNAALSAGLRGLVGGRSLAIFLREQRNARDRRNPPRLTAARILKWADAHFRRTSFWPSQNSGEVPEAPGECWQTLNAALRTGGRGLPGGDSLPTLLQRCRGVAPFVGRARQSGSTVECRGAKP